MKLKIFFVLMVLCMILLSVYYIEKFSVSDSIKSNESVPLKVEKQHCESSECKGITHDYEISVIGKYIIIKEHLVSVARGHDIEINAIYDGPNKIIVTEQEIKREGSAVSQIIDFYKVKEILGPLPKGEYVVKVTLKTYEGNQTKKPIESIEDKVETSVSVK